MSSLMENRVVLPSINYADIAPEVIENEVRLIRFTPTQTINNAQQNDIIKFIMQSNGFFDPYSAVLRFTVDVPADTLNGNEMRFVDRSAHSFIYRFLVRSQGIELERIENYDTIAAMINDTLYSQEQNTLHGHEGFPTQQVDIGAFEDFVYEQTATAANPAVRSVNGNLTDTASILGLPLPSNNGAQLDYVINGTSAMNPTLGASEPMFASIGARRTALQVLSSNSTRGNVFDKVGEPAFFNAVDAQVTNVVVAAGTGVQIQPSGENFSLFPSDLRSVPQAYADDNGQYVPAEMITSDYQNDGVTYSRTSYSTTQLAATSYAYTATTAGQNLRQFSIPLYSGLLGVLQPQKKLIPLSLLPIDLELQLNPNALYSSQKTGGRNYLITRIEIYANVLFFEQSVHQALEAIVARQGIHIHCNSFYNAPQTIVQNQVLPGYAQINMAFKSINSIHWAFMYNNYQSTVCARKNHFVSHNLSRIQLRNGLTLLPSEPLESIATNGTSGTNNDGSYVPFFIETLKAWGQLHNPAFDCGLYAYNICGDQNLIAISPLTYTLSDIMATYPFTSIETIMYGGEATQLNIESKLIYDTFLFQLIAKQANVGRAQYGMSMEGEELGEMKNFLTGRKGMLPFDINLGSASKASRDPSIMMIFIRHDSVVHIRPDLTPELLGR